MLNDFDRQELDFLETLPMALMVVDEYIHVMKANTAASNVVADSEFVSIEQNMLCGARNSQQNAIEEAVSRIIREEKIFEEFVLSSRNPLRLRVSVQPIRVWGDQKPYALLHFTAINTMYNIGGHLTDVYKLTKAELRVANALVEGMTPNEIAKTYHVSHNTVRAQLKSIFKKTNTQRQSQLVKLLISLEQVTPIEKSGIDQPYRKEPCC